MSEVDPGWIASPPWPSASLASATGGVGPHRRRQYQNPLRAGFCLHGHPNSIKHTGSQPSPRFSDDIMHSSCIVNFATLKGVCLLI